MNEKGFTLAELSVVMGIVFTVGLIVLTIILAGAAYLIYYLTS